MSVYLNPVYFSAKPKKPGIVLPGAKGPKLTPPPSEKAEKVSSAKTPVALIITPPPKKKKLLDRLLVAALFLNAGAMGTDLWMHQPKPIPIIKDADSTSKLPEIKQAQAMHERYQWYEGKDLNGRSVEILIPMTWNQPAANSMEYFYPAEVAPLTQKAIDEILKNYTLEQLQTSPGLIRELLVNGGVNGHPGLIEELSQKGIAASLGDIKINEISPD